MVPIGGKPFLEHLINLVRENGITDVLVLLGYLPERVIEYFGDGKKFGVNIHYDTTPVEYDTGTRIKHAEPLLDDSFLLMYCDNYWPMHLPKLIKFYREKNVAASVVVYASKESNKNNMFVDENGYVVKYDKTRTEPGLNGVDIGFFLLHKNVLALAPKENFHFEDQILKKLIAERQLAGYLTGHRYYSIGSIDRLPVTEEFFTSRKIVFIDRDGVINKKAPKADYVKSWKEFTFLPGAIEGLALLSRRGYEIYIISNQAGIARGVMTIQDLHDIHGRMLKELEKHNVKIAGIYFCPHGWGDDCDCRKPKPGMLFQAANEHHFDATKALMIGDDVRDVEAAEAAGSRSVLMKPDGNLLLVVQSMA